MLHCAVNWFFNFEAANLDVVLLVAGQHFAQLQDELITHVLVVWCLLLLGLLTSLIPAILTPWPRLACKGALALREVVGVVGQVGGVGRQRGVERVWHVEGVRGGSWES